MWPFGKYTVTKGVPMAEEKKKTVAPSASSATKSTKSSKATKERTFTSASTGERVEKTMGHAAGTAVLDLDASHAQRKAQAKGKRTAAMILWIVAIVLEVVAILGATGKIMNWTGQSAFGVFTYGWTFLIIMLVVIAALAIVGSQLWKSANHIDPPKKEGNAFKYWTQTELGSIMAVLAFLPIILVLLLSKDVNPDTRKYGLIGAAVALALGLVTGIDYNPTSAEELDQMEIEAAQLADGGLCYWTPYGTKYHFNPDCRYIKNSTNITQGTVQEAYDAGRQEPCSGCAVEGGQYVLHTHDSGTDSGAEGGAEGGTEDGSQQEAA